MWSALLMTLAAGAAEPAILQVGTFPAEEVGPEAAGGAWAVVPALDGGWSLERVVVTTEAVAEGVALRATGADPLFVMRDVPGLVAGPLDAAATDPEPWLLPGDARDIATAGGLELRLETVGRQLEGSGGRWGLDEWEDYALSVVSDGRRQLLVTHPTVGYEAFPSVIWAGDLNRDGVLDLVLNTSNHYAVLELNLVLSGGDGTLQSVALKRSTGC